MRLLARIGVTRIARYRGLVVLAPTSMNDSEERANKESQVGLAASCPAPGRQRSGSKGSSMKGDTHLSMDPGLGINEGERMMRCRSRRSGERGQKVSHPSSRRVANFSEQFATG